MPRRHVEEPKRRVLLGPRSGGVKDSLSELATALGNSNCKGVIIAIQRGDDTVEYSLHGEFHAAKLALVAALLTKWAVE